MSTATLHIDLGALCRNWLQLRALSRGRAGAVIKANAYGMGLRHVGRALQAAGARDFFVANSDEGVRLRDTLGPEARIFVLCGHMSGASAQIRDAALVPALNSGDQFARHQQATPGVPFAIQLNTGMNRLGMEPEDWAAVRQALPRAPELVMSHLACADEAEHPMNERQLATFEAMTAGMNVPRSFANTGGVLLGPRYHFELTRPGIGTYGGLPFADAEPVVTLDIPVIQCRSIAAGETVGYGGSFTASRPSRIATIAAGYADGILRACGNGGRVWAHGVPCPLAGRVSMDLIGVDVTDLGYDPDTLRLLGPEQTVDDLADVAGTIGYEVLTSLGDRYNRRYMNA